MTDIPELFGDWLDQTYKLQLEAYNNDLHELDGFDLRYYLTWNHSAAVAEMTEMLEETRWKPWDSTDLANDAIVPDKKAFTKEAVDVLHFIANMLVAAKVTTAELNDVYTEKMAVNRERQLRKGGYQSKVGQDKCLVCRRSFDDVGASTAMPGHCVKCEAEKARAMGLGL